jgi:hypothetical protein
MWIAIGVTFDVKNLNILDNLFNPWLRSFVHKQRKHVLLGATAFCWALWLNRNEAIFQRSKSTLFLQVMFRGTYWIRSWSILSKEDEMSTLKGGCRWLEIMLLEFFKKKWLEHLEGNQELACLCSCVAGCPFSFCKLCWSRSTL